MSPAQIHAAAVKAACCSHTTDPSRVLGPGKQRALEIAIRAYLAALREAGWKVVPREATREQKAGALVAFGNDRGWDVIGGYPIMHDAAPTWPPEGA